LSAKWAFRSAGHLRRYKESCYCKDCHEWGTQG
jgi:hypothetical protein